MIATMRQRSFALYWFGGLISEVGDWVLNIGLPIYVYLLTRSVAATSITFICGIVPMIALSSVAGVFVDRWNRQRTLVVVNILLALGLVPLLFVHGANDVWIVYAVNALESTLEQFLLPAQGALVPAVVGEEHLVPANSLSAFGSSLARLGGPPLGGLIAAAFGLTGIVAADGASYVIAALCIAGMRVAARPAAPAGQVTAPGVSASTARKNRNPLRALVRVWREWVDGLRLITSHPLLRVLVIVLAFASLGEGFFGPLYPVFVYQQLHGEALQIGELMTAQAVGGLVAGVVVGWIGKRALGRWVSGLGWIGFGVIVLAIAYAPALLPQVWPMLTGSDLSIPIFWVELGLFAAVGIPGLIGSTGTISLLQARSPEAHRGRVLGARGAISGVMLLIGVVAAGTLPDWVGVVPVFSGQGWAKIVGGLVMILFLPAVHAASRTAAATETSDAPGHATSVDGAAVPIDLAD